MRIADIESRGYGDLRLRYTRDALDRWPINTPVISGSLRVGRAWQPASAYLRGLLPEGAHLAAAAQAARVATSDTYGLLRRYGRDVAGALIICPHDDVPDESRWGVDLYTTEGLATAVGALHEGTEVVPPDSELSIAGLQNKLLLVETESEWGRPTGGQPSTHILKADDPQRPGLIEAEFHALTIAYSLRIAASAPQFLEAAGHPCLIVRRFDRAAVDGRVERLHQEDACQALGIHHEASDGRGKYESAGGPSFRQIADLLRAEADDANRELIALARLMTFTAAIGNADGHGKNVAVIHELDGRMRLAPAYDTVPTMLWPALRTRLGMFIGGLTDLTQINRNALILEAVGWRLTRQLATSTVDDTLDQIRDAAVHHDALAELIVTNLDRITRAGSNPSYGSTKRT